ncbi:MAG: biopolymer transporter ExbD [Sandaracinaceae bacterium]|nr:biopolymer transporter ExbD [Sandaracinaceae bacterium]MDW8246391.1 biopolymer transporter ExbD [Sandaracinaceae bacterium]
MGGINVGGGGHGGKKSVDSEIPLVPFIDLLLCCVMFLLVTAVWNRLARLDANQQTPGQVSNPTDVEEPQIRLFLQVTGSGYTIASTAGERIEIPKNGENYDFETLRTKLKERRQAEPNRRDIIVAPEDGIPYHEVISAMDIAIGEGYQQVSLSDGAML